MVFFNRFDAFYIKLGSFIIDVFIWNPTIVLVYTVLWMIFEELVSTEFIWYTLSYKFADITFLRHRKVKSMRYDHLFLLTRCRHIYYPPDTILWFLPSLQTYMTHIYSNRCWTLKIQNRWLRNSPEWWHKWTIDRIF